MHDTPNSPAVQRLLIRLRLMDADSFSSWIGWHGGRYTEDEITALDQLNRELEGMVS